MLLEEAASSHLPHSVRKGSLLRACRLATLSGLGAFGSLASMTPKSRQSDRKTKPQEKKVSEGRLCFLLFCVHCPFTTYPQRQVSRQDPASAWSREEKTVARAIQDPNSCPNK